MSRSPVEVVRALLEGATSPEVVHELVAADATYVSLTFHNPELTAVMPWAGTHAGDGAAAILKTFQDVNSFWTVVAFEPRHVLGDGENVAVFGSFTLRSAVLGREFTSPFSVLATVREGRVVYMQYMEDTFGTGATFRSGGRWTFRADPEGGEVAVG